MHAPDGQPLAIGNLSLSEAAPDIINGYQLLWNGEMRMTLDIYRDMLMALGAALTAVYFLLVAYYKSFLIPLIALRSEEHTSELQSLMRISYAVFCLTHINLTQACQKTHIYNYQSPRKY